MRTDLRNGVVLIGLTALALVGCGEAEPPENNGPSALENVGRGGELHRGELQTPDGPRSVEYEEVDGRAVIEGDIVMPLPMLEKKDDLESGSGFQGGIVPRSAARASEIAHWDGGIIPYQIGFGVDTARVQAAIAHWQSKTSIRFVARTSEFSYVRFERGTGCYSPVGRLGGPQTIGLEPACSVGNIIHEIGHTVGLWHEQTRTDRDRYVSILWPNIQPGKEHNFANYYLGSLDGMDLGSYDYGSIMHYGAYDFSRNGNPTIMPLVSGVTIGQRSGLSSGDLAAVRFLYQQQNWDLPGSDLRSFDLPNTQTLLCKAACAQDPACKAYTYVRPGASGFLSPARCWLKGSVPAAVYNPNCISGQVVPLESNTYRAGSTYDSRVFSPITGEADCRQACAREQRCQSFSYYEIWLGGPLFKGFCELKDDVPRPTEKPGYLSGVKHGLEYNANRYGSDYRGFDATSSDPKECQAACAAESPCQSFTYVRPGVQGPKARCWLKSGIPAATVDGNTISGIKGLEF